MRTISPNSLNSINHESNGQQSILSSPNRSGCLPLDLKGERTESLQPVCETTVRISSLKIRLAPTIKNTLATAVDTLLSEVAVVIDDFLTKSRQELLTQEQENERLRLRLKESEGELKALQDCVCSAQKIIDHFPASLPGPGNLGPQGFFSSTPSACGGNNVPQLKNSSGPFSNRTADYRKVEDLHGCNSQKRCSFTDTLQRFDSRDDYKACQLSIEADGRVSCNLLNTVSTSSPCPWPDNSKPDDCATEQLGQQCPSNKQPSSPGLKSEPGTEIKREQEQGAGQHGRGAAGEEGVAVGVESEQTARNVAELGYIHVVEEEDALRSHTSPIQQQKHPHMPLQRQRRGCSASLSEGLKILAKPSHGTQLSQVSMRGTAGANGPSATSPVAGDERPHLCLQCGKTFRLLSSLKKHIRIHTGEKPYPCPVCGRCFRESGALKTHQRIHTGEKPYTCLDCGTNFRHLDGLRKHRRTHTGEKPYVCSVCGKRLSRLQHLKHHQRIHTGERPCRCPHCHKCFKEPAALRKHLRTHGEEPGGTERAREEMGMAPAGLGGTSNINRVHQLMLPPPMGFGSWGADGEDGGVMNYV
ncbi:hypothetical protein GJAV_G00130250 [Gymnothorax javanicus]|nr:hypothetical protein GJAV_G00130250 [Gymnothorax javanicus]